MAAGRPLASRQGLFASGERKPGKEEEGGRLSIGGSVVVVVEGGRKTDRPGSAYRLFDSIKNERPIRRGLQDTSAPLSATIILSLSLSPSKKKKRRNRSKIELRDAMVLAVSWRGWFLWERVINGCGVGTRVLLYFRGLEKVICLIDQCLR